MTIKRSDDGYVIKQHGHDGWWDLWRVKINPNDNHVRFLKSQ